MANIPYQLVSMAAILRDYTDPKYISDEHYKLTSIADYFYNACFGDYDNDAKNLLPEYKAVYDEYGAEFFEKVLDDMYALDSQVTGARKEQELLDDYNDRLNSVSASSKICSNKSVKASSWKDQREGGYGSVYDIDYDNHNPMTVAGWELTFGAYIDEDGFWFDENDEGGDGGTNIGAIAYFEKAGAEIEIAFSIGYSIFGDIDNPDEFFLTEPDRGLDWENGIQYSILKVNGIDEYDAKEFIEDNHREIFDALISVVNDNLYKFGYEL